MGWWEEWTGYKPNLGLFAGSGCSLDLNLRSHAPKPLPLHRAIAQNKAQMDRKNCTNVIMNFSK